MKKLLFLFLFASAIMVTGCSGDEDNSTDDTSQTDDDATTLETEQIETTETLAGATGKVWHISNAILTNTSGTIDISENFNVVDDEFIFTPSASSTAGSLEWRPGNAIGVEGASNQETLLDFYTAPSSFIFSFEEESSTNLISIDGRFVFTLIDDNTISGMLTFESGRSSSGETIEMSLTPKTESDYRTPAASLSFSEVFTFGSNNIYTSSPGMVGSYSDNSFFIATREDAFFDGTTRPERIIKYDFDTNTSTEYLYFHQDFVSKQLKIIDNELIVFGGQFVNTYDLNLSGDPITQTHGLTLSRFGYAVSGEDSYVVGGSILDNTLSNQIHKWDGNSLSLFTVMPETRSSARAEIINDKLYVFGGELDFVTLPGQDTIYVIDILTGDLIETPTLPSPVDFTFTSVYENLIYVSGQIKIDDGAGGIADSNNFFGVFNTLDNTFTEIPTNLDDSGINQTINSMAIFNGKVYVLYGMPQEVAEGELQQWSVMSASIE